MDNCRDKSEFSSANNKWLENPKNSSLMRKEDYVCEDTLSE
jgi:hypothetical protein